MSLVTLTARLKEASTDDMLIELSKLGRVTLRFTNTHENLTGWKADFETKNDLLKSSFSVDSEWAHPTPQSAVAELRDRVFKAIK